MKKRYVVKLTSDERDQLEGIVNRGREAADRRRHAQILLLVDEGEQVPGFFDKDACPSSLFFSQQNQTVRLDINLEEVPGEWLEYTG